MKGLINFKDFASNPVSGVLLLSIIAIGYLYVDNKTTLTSHIKVLQEEVITLRDDYKKLNDKFISAITCAVVAISIYNHLFFQLFT